MSEDKDRFRSLMSHFATGVTIVTGVEPEGGPVGLTANAVASVSLEPPLLLVCMERRSSSLDVVLRTGRFGLSILRRGDEELARRFSEDLPAERFRGLTLTTAESGMPVLAECLAWVDCKMWRGFEAGDHRIVVGEVLECHVSSGDPLVFFKGEYGTIALPRE